MENGTYIGFLVLTFLGALLALTLLEAKNVVRTDGSHVIVMKHPSWKSEFIGMFQTLRTDWYIAGLFPMFWASNWFYTYQFNVVNAAYFSVRARALNSILYWLAQMVGSGIFGYSLDYQGLSRAMKAKIAWLALLLLTLGIWGGGYAFEKQYTREQAAAKTFNTKVRRPFMPRDKRADTLQDFEESGYVGPMFLYIFYGFFDSVWQTTVYWYMGSLTNNGRKLANFAGFYK